MTDGNALTPFENGEFRLDVQPHPTDGFRVPAEQVARALSTRGRDLVRSIPDEEKGRALVRTPGGEQESWYLTEAGFYRAIGQRQTGRIDDPDTRAQVERFQAWVYRDVLPSIRKAGGYGTPAAPDLTVLDSGTIDYLTQLSRGMQLAIESAKANQAKADAFDAFLNGKGCYLIDTVANLIGSGHKALWNLLYAERILIEKGHRRRQPRALTKTKGWFTVKTHDQAKTNGHATSTTYVTPYGLEQIRQFAIEHGLIEPQLLALTSTGTKAVQA